MIFCFFWGFWFFSSLLLIRKVKPIRSIGAISMVYETGPLTRISLSLSPLFTLLLCLLLKKLLLLLGADVGVSANLPLSQRNPFRMDFTKGMFWTRLHLLCLPVCYSQLIPHTQWTFCTSRSFSPSVNLSLKETWMEIAGNSTLLVKNLLVEVVDLFLQIVATI